MVKISSTPCPECNGKRVSARIHDEMRWSTGGTYSSSHSFRALICSKCGHTTFYANGVSDIARELREQETK